MKLIIIIILFSLKAFAPSEDVLYIYPGEPITPFEDIWKAVCTVESNHDPFAIGDKHLDEWSYGIAQIRQIRLDDYNDRTNSNLQIVDCFDPDISKRVFMYYAQVIGPYDKDLIVRRWNGSGSKTYEYLAKVNGTK